MAQTIVITGTASGFGRAAVGRFNREGWNVVATVRKDADLGIHDDLDNVHTLLLDVNDEATGRELAENAVAQYGRVDAVVNNAGYSHAGPLEASTSDQIHRQFQTNLFGLIAVTQGFIPHFRAQRSGVIVNISSISAEQGYPYNSVYAASKAAVATLTEGLNVELGQFGVSAKAVFPGLHATKIFTKVDATDNIPDDYLGAMHAFTSFNMNGGASTPSVTADVIYQAVTDGNTSKVRYYSGPDGTVIPRAKQLLGGEWYWEEFRAANMGDPSALWTSLLPSAGVARVETSS